jgi:hypothetical protein
LFQDKSFSSESGGGGPQSNMHLVPYLVIKRIAWIMKWIVIQKLIQTFLKRLPGVGSEPGSSQFHLFLIFTTVPLSHSGSPKIDPNFFNGC